MRLVTRACRKLVHSECENCWCLCHWDRDGIAKVYGPQFTQAVPDGTVKALGGKWEPPPPRPAALVRALAVIANPWMWSPRLGGWLDDRVLVWKVRKGHREVTPGKP